ncbi:hypothetical protein EW146_g1096 [Bondarzewia mesenterica]|uniref:U three protein 23 n=1 Tax=Bondarzewia mesenterica TaxID=1095465 RepID=A0A4S4M6U0_9AGAM|nr:hypothetical protein EW146_g1096 [Bondarzewia mesenterica]
MSLYSLSFGFRQPYQVLVDSEMCKTAVSQKLDFNKQLGIVLQGTVKPMITQCCIHELYLQGKSLQPAVDLAKTFERRKCNHKEAIPGDDCLTSVIGDTNKHRYVVATQSHPLRVKLRSIPGVPILHINRSVMILEPPSDTTLRAKQLAEQQSLAPSTSESAKLKAAAPPQPEPLKKKKKGPKGPNPLSVKKKKTVEQPILAKAKTDKGKGKESQKGASFNNVTRPDAKDKAGEKRKRDDEAEIGGVPKHADDQDVRKEGHKRKRRRKTTSHPSSENRAEM